MSEIERTTGGGEIADDAIRRLLSEHLRPGEALAQPSAHEPDDTRDTLGYEVYPIKDEAGGEIGSSVFLVMKEPGVAVEAVELTGETELTITPVAGEGIVGFWVPDEGAGAELLIAGDGPNDGGSFTLEQGWSYGYLNTGSGPFVVRDDSKRPFKPEYERPVTDPQVLHALSELGIRGALGE